MGRYVRGAEAMTHACQIPHCRALIPDDRLMCLKHWRMVPRDLQRDVWRHYRQGQCGDMRPSEAYLGAARAAVQAVQNKLQKKANRDDSLKLF